MADIYAIINGGTPAGGETSLAGEMGDLLLVVSQQLQDEFGVTWPPSKTLRYVNLALLEIVKLRPDASPEERVVTLEAGARQSLAMTTTLSLLSSICNINGTSEIGQTVTTIEKKALDQLLPGWMTYPANQTVSHVAKDDQNPLVFHVFPPQPAASPGKLKLLVSAPPAGVTVETTDFPLNASYKPAFIDCMIHKCLSEETTIPGAMAKAATYYNKFLIHLGLNASQKAQ